VISIDLDLWASFGTVKEFPAEAVLPGGCEF
jgi:hypothetical protein